MTLLSSFNSHDEMLSGPVPFLDFINLIVNLISFVSVGFRNRLCVILLVFKYCVYMSYLVMTYIIGRDVYLYAHTMARRFCYSDLLIPVHIRCLAPVSIFV